MVCAGTLTRAEQLLRARTFDLIICTIVFDESRMLDLLRVAKAHRAWRLIPFVCARARQDVKLSPLALEAVKFTTEALGAVAFLDVVGYRVNPEREFRNEIDRILAQ